MGGPAGCFNAALTVGASWEVGKRVTSYYFTGIAGIHVGGFVSQVFQTKAFFFFL